MTKFLALSRDAANHFQSYGIPSFDWFNNVVQAPDGLPSLVSGEVVIVATPSEMDRNSVDGWFLFRLGEADVLFPEIKQERRPEAFKRALRVVVSAADKTMAIPSLWRPFNRESLISIQSNARATGERARLLVDRRSYGMVSAFCYGVIADDVDLQTKIPSLPDLTRVSRDIASAFELLVNQHQLTGASELEGDFSLDRCHLPSLGESLATWYDSKLTKQQRQFVDFPLQKSIRLRGPAGSGKTISLVVKLLRQLIADRARGRASRYAMLTHSASTVELIETMVRTMVTEREYDEITQNGRSVYFGTLYDLAYSALRAEEKGVRPISLDGKEGQELQREALAAVTNEFLTSDWIARRGGCSDEFIKRIESQGQDDELFAGFLCEVQNEFSCIIEPEGISRTKKKREHYLDQRRESWMMVLGTRDERLTILDLHSRFRKFLRGMEAISLEQLIVDYEADLDGNIWEATRTEEGFDAIFVDELHSLNRHERTILPMLMKSDEQLPIIVMAQDEKQALRRTGSGISSWQREVAPDWQNFELSEIFRYTPQINAFLRSLDEFSPALTLQEEWPNYHQESKVENGDVPDVTELTSEREIYRLIFPRASLAAKRWKRGRLVAVLVCDFEAFTKYLTAGEHRTLYTPVESRDDIALLPSTGTKFVYSMPEYVAGLQFEEVFLLDVNADLQDDSGRRPNRDRRRLLAEVYLGASRARRALHLVANQARGGNPAFIEYALKKGTSVRFGPGSASA